MRIAHICQHSFIADVLTRDAAVLDLGMNEGSFSRAISERFGCRVVGVEAVPALFAALPSLPRVTAEQRAITADGEPVHVYLNEGVCATIEPGLAQAGAATVEVAGTTIPELMARHGLKRVALVKLDVEGAELPILAGLAPDVLTRIDQLTVEFHDFLDPGQAPAVAEVTRRLEALGFVRFAFSLDNTDVLFVNRARVRFGPRERLWLMARYKYPRGIRRRVRRRLLGASA